MSSQGMIIKELREKKGMTQGELGKAIGTTKQNIFKYESGAVDTIPNKKLQALAKALDVEPWDILGWDIPGVSGQKKEYISSPSRLNTSGVMGVTISSLAIKADRSSLPSPGERSSMICSYSSETSFTRSWRINGSSASFVSL